MPQWQEEQEQQQMEWDEAERLAAKQRSLELTARVAALRARQRANKSRVQRLMRAVLAAAESGERDFRAERELAESGAGREAVEELVQVALENSSLEEEWAR